MRATKMAGSADDEADGQQPKRLLKITLLAGPLWLLSLVGWDYNKK
jgi:hypothetical protein